MQLDGLGNFWLRKFILFLLSWTPGLIALALLCYVVYSHIYKYVHTIVHIIYLYVHSILQFCFLSKQCMMSSRSISIAYIVHKAL